jgi:hypothetical protein
MKTLFQTYASALLQKDIDPQNAYEAACDEFDLDYDSPEVESWFEQLEAAE